MRQQWSVLFVLWGGRYMFALRNGRKMRRTTTRECFMCATRVLMYVCVFATPESLPDDEHGCDTQLQCNLSSDVCVCGCYSSRRNIHTLYILMVRTQTAAQPTYCTCAFSDREYCECVHTHCTPLKMGNIVSCRCV